MTGGADAAARVTVVTVTHRSAGAIAGFLESLPPALPIVVVDNASSDGTADLIAAATAPQARVIRNSVNRGFGAGCNAGIDQTQTEFVLLLNPDARLAPGAVETLVAAADAWPDAAILAPSITAAQGQRVRSCGRAAVAPCGQGPSPRAHAARRQAGRGSGRPGRNAGLAGPGARAGVRTARLSVRATNL